MTININKMNDTIQDTIKVGLANASAIGISLTEINEVLSTISLVMAISFSIYQFIKQTYLIQYLGLEILFFLHHLTYLQLSLK